MKLRVAKKIIKRMKDKDGYGQSDHFKKNGTLAKAVKIIRRQGGEILSNRDVID